MNILAIRSFLHVAETGSFTLAAQRLQVMQSTISGRIQALEDELGCALFRRGRGGAELTSQGNDFRVHAEQIVQTWDQARQQVALPPGFTAMFRFGGPVTLQEHLSLEWVLWMREHAPYVALRLEAGASELLIDALTTGMMDAAIIYLRHQRSGLILEELLQEDLILVEHPSLNGKWQDKFVMINWGHEFKLGFSQAFPDVPTATISVGIAALGLKYVLALQGAAYLPLSLAGPLLDRGELHRISDAPIFHRPVYLVYPSQSRDPELLSLALGGLRAVAARINGTRTI
jgi:LysR family transcriptional regulator, flagellar master operon regulator